MTAHLLNRSLIAAMAVIAIRPASAQAARPSESGFHPSIQQTAPQQIARAAMKISRSMLVSTNGPIDPTDPSRPLMCNKMVQREFREAFMKTGNGDGRMGLAEAGRSIELIGGMLSFGSWVTSAIDDGETGEKANRMSLLRDDNSIAVFHTHGNNARPFPSAADLRGDVPDFVISRFAVYVTIPGTGMYVRLDPSACKF